MQVQLNIRRVRSSSWNVLAGRAPHLQHKAAYNAKRCCQQVPPPRPFYVLNLQRAKRGVMPPAGKHKEMETTKMPPPQNTGKRKPPRCHHWENTIQQKPPEQATDAAISKTQGNGGHHDATIGKTQYFVPRAVAVDLSAQFDEHQLSIVETCWHALISATSSMSTNFVLQRTVGMCFSMVRAICGTLGNTACTKRHSCSIRLRRGR